LALYKEISVIYMFHHEEARPDLALAPPRPVQTKNGFKIRENV
jgi:hypothetical protein